jgi:hypothetical protein
MCRCELGFASGKENFGRSGKRANAGRNGGEHHSQLQGSMITTSLSVRWRVVAEYRLYITYDLEI